MLGDARGRLSMGWGMPGAPDPPTRRVSVTPACLCGGGPGARRRLAVSAGPLQERRQIRCLIVFERTRTHREGILTPGRRLGQRPAAPLRVATSPCLRRADAAAHSTLKTVTRDAL